ncbi:hypothetical protein F2Q69_00006980 [Brassica cretica]|uniref:Uncharacterized protein n=1 Tax=Brassica cretica TaxID=69181 RepID=A0A8S9PAF3_BRACR|nr:hypothetical protein F2Q69_00006980 [Brassica cretica]
MWYVDYVVFVGSEAGFIGSREKSGSSSCETSFSPPNMELYRGDRRNMQRDLFSCSCPSLLRGGREWGLSSLLEDARGRDLAINLGLIVSCPPVLLVRCRGGRTESWLSSAGGVAGLNSPLASLEWCDDLAPLAHDAQLDHDLLNTLDFGQLDCPPHDQGEESKCHQY